MLLRERAAKGGTIAECLVRRKVDEDDFLEVRWVGWLSAATYGGAVVVKYLWCSRLASRNRPSGLSKMYVLYQFTDKYTTSIQSEFYM